MRISVARVGRRVARWSAGLLLAPTGLFTFALFFTTGGPLPSGFVPIDRLGFGMATYTAAIERNTRPCLRLPEPKSKRPMFYYSLASYTNTRPCSWD